MDPTNNTHRADLHPALLVIDMQEDFCPPNGMLAVPSGRALAAPINELLQMPWHLRIATRDFHPPSHISFAHNHPPPDNVPFVSTTLIRNPLNADEVDESRLWPAHCVQGTPGAELIPELHRAQLDFVVDKGQDARVEMYSAFGDPFTSPPVATTELATLLREREVTHVFVVGLALDYCVKYTALHARREGWPTFVVEDATRAVDEAASGKTLGELVAAGVSIVRLDGPELKWVGRGEA
ncbi:MAG: NAD(+) salvage pathway protein [Trizodia sp. TS-e1964]|nr:MAG: NAD(+) salvage pathway protein [Trizodia sp. TS-e1964]